LNAERAPQLKHSVGHTSEVSKFETFLMERMETFFMRWEQWAERNSRILGVAIVLFVAVFFATYYSSGSFLQAWVVVAFIPLALIMGTALLGLIFVPAILSVDRLAEKLAGRGWPYWLAFLCMSPIGIIVIVVMVFLIDWSFSVAMP
jgi:hypothetical protein